MKAGFSTGAVARGDIAAGIAVNESHDAPIIELSSLSENELDQLTGLVAGHAAEGFERISTHGPVKDRRLDEADLVARLDALGLDVVMHPDVFIDVTAWQPLGSRLLVENNDGRKTTGRTVAELEEFFTALPDACFCLDVSHALHVGGHRNVVDLAARFGDRLVQIHAGCACGEPLGVAFDDQLVAAVAAVADTIGWAPPVILERTTPADDHTALAAQLAAIDAIS